MEKETILILTEEGLSAEIAAKVAMSIGGLYSESYADIRTSLERS